MLWIYFTAWFPMMLIAIANGAARDLLYKATLGELRAHQVSTVSLIALLTFYIGFVTSIWRLESSLQALLVGALWLGMTLLFEFGFGHFVAGKPWGTLLQDYNLVAGRVWVFIPVWIAIVPYIFYQWQPV